MLTKLSNTVNTRARNEAQPASTHLFHFINYPEQRNQSHIKISQTNARDTKQNRWKTQEQSLIFEGMFVCARVLRYISKFK